MIALTDSYSVEWELWTMYDNIATWKARAALEAEATRQRDIAQDAERERAAEVTFLTAQVETRTQQRDDLQAGMDAVREALREYDLTGNLVEAIHELAKRAQKTAPEPTEPTGGEGKTIVVRKEEWHATVKHAAEKEREASLYKQRCQDYQAQIARTTQNAPAA